MARRVLQLLAIAFVLTVVVVGLFHVVYGDYLKVRGDYSKLKAGRLEPQDLDADGYDEIYKRTLPKILPRRSFNMDLAAKLHEILWSLGEKERALDIADRLVEARPLNRGLRLKYADTLAEMGRTDDAEEQYERVLKLTKGGKGNDAIDWEP